MIEFLQSIFGDDLQAAFLIVLNLIVIESLLSVDNAAVIATMVMDLPEKQRGKALRYGIIGAYVFRGLCLVFAAYLVQFAWLKGLGGLYLVYLAVHYFLKSKKKEGSEEQSITKDKSWIYRVTVGAVGQFWSTVILVEAVDLAFSIDNVFAAVAFTNNLFVIMLGVFIGILAMRFVAQWFVQLMVRFTFLDEIAFLVIGVLGLKLVLSFVCDEYYKGTIWCEYVNGHEADWYVSVLTILMFVLPVASSLLFNYPRRGHKEEPKQS